MHQAQQGDPATAIAHIETSLRLAPLAHRSNAVGSLAVALFRLGRFEESVAFGREFTQRTGSPMGHLCLAGGYAQLGQASAAVAALSRFRALSTLPVEVVAGHFLPNPAELRMFLDCIAAAEAASLVDGRAPSPTL
jgi:hypothetical protein